MGERLQKGFQTNTRYLEQPSFVTSHLYLRLWKLGDMSAKRTQSELQAVSSDPEDAALDDWLPLEAVRDMAAAVADGMCATMGVVCRESSTAVTADL